MAGITLTTPLMMAVGSVLQLPVAALADWWLHGLHPGLGAVLGYLCVMCGFLWLTLSRFREAQEDVPSGELICAADEAERTRDEAPSSHPKATDLASRHKQSGT